MQDPEESFELLHSGRWYVVRQKKVWRPPTDVFETDAAVVVRVEVAGLNAGEFHVEYDDQRLAVSGTRRDPGVKLSYQQMEIRYGDFESVVHIPWAVDADRIEATYADGFLEVTLPKARTKHIPLRSEEPE